MSNRDDILIAVISVVLSFTAYLPHIAVQRSYEQEGRIHLAFPSRTWKKYS